MKFLQGLLLSLLLASGGSTADTAGDGDIAWYEACYRSGYDCTNLRQPQIVEDDEWVADYGAYGLYYPGQEFVVIRETWSDIDLKTSVLVHEFVHYLQWRRGNLESSCAHEREAFTIGDEYVVSLGRIDLWRGPEWHRAYPGCDGIDMS